MNKVFFVIDWILRVFSYIMVCVFCKYHYQAIIGQIEYDITYSVIAFIFFLYCMHFVYDDYKKE